MFHRARQSAIKPWRCAAVVGRGKAGQFRAMSSSASEDELFTDSDDNSESNFSYGVRKTTEWFKEKDMKNGYRLCKVLDPTVNTGIYVDFPHGLTLSVETHPLACMSDFAETVIMPTSDTEKSMSDLDEEDDSSSSRLIALAPLGYDEDCTLKHREPKDLFDHIVKFNEMLKTAKTVDGVVHLASGESIDLSDKSKAKGDQEKEKKSDTHIYVKSNFKL